MVSQLSLTNQACDDRGSYLMRCELASKTNYSLNQLTMPRIMSMRVRRMGPIFQQYIIGFQDELRKTKVIVWGQASFKEIGLKGGAREKNKRILEGK